ncbi:hypothetical protein MMC07_004804 [Pseudocyphellaria aurata]|nr:hypothetical protein [Pseudocyphellaria aurata]
MKSSVFSATTWLTFGTSVLGGPLSLQQEIRDFDQGALSFGAVLPTTASLSDARDTSLDTSTDELHPSPGTPPAPAFPLDQPENLPVPVGPGGNYATLATAFALDAPDTPALPKFQSKNSAYTTNPTNPTTFVGFDGQNLAKLTSASASGTDTLLNSFGDTYTIPNTQSGIGTSVETAMKLPETLDSQVRSIAKGEYAFCFWVLSDDKKGIDTVGVQNCDDSRSWDDFTKLFKSTSPGFALYNINQNTILSLMNVVHDCEIKNRDPLLNYVYWEPEDQFGCSDRGTLKGLEPGWVNAVEGILSMISKDLPDAEKWHLVSEDRIGDDKWLETLCKRYLESQGLPCKTD